MGLVPRRRVSGPVTDPRAAVAVLVVLAAARVLSRALRRSARRGLRRWQRRALRSVGRALVGLVLARWVTRPAGAGWRAYRQRRNQWRVPMAGDDIYRACALTPWAGDPTRCRWCNQPLAAEPGPFCGPACGDTGRSNHVFAAAKVAARQRDRYRCVRCGGTRRLQVNHKVPVLGRHGEPGCHHHLVGLETLCAGRGSCHQGETNRQRRAGLFRPGRKAA